MTKFQGLVMGDLRTDPAVLRPAPVAREKEIATITKSVKEL